MINDRRSIARNLVGFFKATYESNAWILKVPRDLVASFLSFHIDGLVQERRNSSALAMELRLSCTDSSI